MESESHFRKSEVKLPHLVRDLVASHSCRGLLLLVLMQPPRGVHSALLVSGQTACSAC
jgi:hypothetical protein